MEYLNHATRETFDYQNNNHYVGMRTRIEEPLYSSRTIKIFAIDSDITSHHQDESPKRIGYRKKDTLPEALNFEFDRRFVIWLNCTKKYEDLIWLTNSHNVRVE